MGLIDRLRRAGGIAKNRLASSVGALKGITVGGGRTIRGVRFAARATRLTSPVGLGLTAFSFAPQIAAGVRTAGRFLQRAIPRGVAFVGGQRVVSGIAGGAGAGVIAGGITGRSSGGVTRPSDDPSVSTVRDPVTGELLIKPRRGPPKGARPGPALREARRRAKRRRKIGTRKKRRAPTRRKRITRKRKRRTHASPRHKGHKVVKFTTAEGKKVRFLVNPRARHR